MIKHQPVETECSVRTEVPIPIAGGRVCTFFTFDGLCDKQEHLAIGFGDWRNQSRPMVRAHSECLTGDVFGSMKCDCGPQLNEAIDTFFEQGGVLLYLRQEGRGIGLYNKLQAYRYQLEGMDTYAANRALGFEDDLRDYYAAGQMLQCLGISKIRLLTNNPEKVRQFAQWVDIERQSTLVHSNKHNMNYLTAKVSVTNHNIKL
ncbi:MAG: GTP cyclohydrolase II RibA [Pseudomonadota bacterium]